MSNESQQIDNTSGNLELRRHQSKQDDFIVVRHRKSRKKQRQEKITSPTFIHDFVASSIVEIASRPETESRSQVLTKVTTATNFLRESTFFTNFQESLSKGFEAVTGSATCPDNLHIFCLGLGSFASHLSARIPRYQLALLVLLKETFNISGELYDPVFTRQEKTILVEDLGFELSEENEEGKRLIESPTLIFMPHCPHQLVNNLLYANWTAESLANCYIVCNSISESLSTFAPTYVDNNLTFIRDAQSICTEIPIPNCFSDHPDIFNDIALHVFSRKSFETLGEDFWLDISVPTYTEKDYVSIAIDNQYN